MLCAEMTHIFQPGPRQKGMPVLRSAKAGAGRTAPLALFALGPFPFVSGWGGVSLGAFFLHPQGCIRLRPLLSGWLILYRGGGGSEAKKKFVYLKSTSKFGPL